MKYASQWKEERKISVAIGDILWHSKKKNITNHQTNTKGGI